MDAERLAKATILMVDDEQANLDLLEDFLIDDGYENLVATTQAREVPGLFDSVRPDLVLLDLHMPHLDGFGVMQQLSARIAENEYLPILVLTADVTMQAKERALSEGARDFLTKPLDPVEVQLRIRNLLETRFLHLEQQAARMRAEFLADASRALAASFDYQTTLATLARLAVPRFADYAVVDWIGAGGESLRLGAAHTDPAMEQRLCGDTSLWGGALPRGHPAVRTLADGEFVLLSGLDDTAQPGAAEADDLVQALAPRSLIYVPLVASGRVRGALGLVTAQSGRRYGSDELALAEELARRAARAIENAELFHSAQQATRARDEVLAVVAHDLRNPLNTIQMGADLLLEELSDASVRPPLQIIHRSAERMNRLIQDLLDVTRVESGNLVIEPHAEQVGSLISEAISMLRPLAEAKAITLEQDVPDDLPQVRMDSTRVMQVISNLTGNAIKFTPSGGRITLGAETEAGEVRLSVADTGPGIPADQIPHIFGRFWQANRSDHRGIGLGLAIAQGIVEAHGGRIWVECPSGGGSTFSFTLPRADLAAATPARQ